jgi:pyridoxal phosphate enzyme (YggS family)
MGGIKENILGIRQRVKLACEKVNRSHQEITVVAVTKGRQLPQINEAIAAGITDIGENRVQEAADKFRNTQYAIGNTQIKRHMVGHLQANKTKEAVRMFDLIHSVDSLRLAKEIGKQAAKLNKVQDILLQINTSGETTKFGARPEEAWALSQDILLLKHVRLQGLMTIAPAVDDPEDARICFRKLRMLRDDIVISSLVPRLSLILSMGMTDDYGVAIEEGADMLRLGRGIFGA